MSVRVIQQPQNPTDPATAHSVPQVKEPQDRLLFDANP